eukprot:5005233-Alexandrium_andersonii.AAC.1
MLFGPQAMDGWLRPNNPPEFDDLARFVVRLGVRVGPNSTHASALRTGAGAVGVGLGVKGRQRGWCP